jgi:hypothetical protein
MNARTGEGELCKGDIVEEGTMIKSAKLNANMDETEMEEGATTIIKTTSLRSQKKKLYVYLVDSKQSSTASMIPCIQAECPRLL